MPVERRSVVPKGDGGYVVLENPPSSQRMRAISRTDAAILSLAARGTPAKSIGYALGTSPSQVSTRLAGASHKVGVLSRVELGRLAALLADAPLAQLDDDALSAAEHAVNSPEL